MKLIFPFLFLFIASITAQYTPSIHQQQLEFYNSQPNANANYYENNIPCSPTSGIEKSGCQLNKVVYGWHPYWVGGVYQNYNWDLLSHFSFFSYEVNAADGQAITTHGWASSSSVDAALLSGNTKVTLTVTLFADHVTFLSSAQAQQTLISNLINLVQSRGAHGVNIDFEGLPSSHKIEFAYFMVNLSNQMHAAIPGSEISTVLYAVDWNNIFDFSLMEPVVDHYIIMGYAYYYQGSSTAGPCDPLYHFGSTYNYTLSKSITYYLDKGCPKEKLILGLPYYGYQWPTASSSVPSATTGSGIAKTFRQIKDNVSGNYDLANHLFDQESYTDIYSFNDGGSYQCFITEQEGFRKRLEHVNTSGIGGIGIWALGYDDGYNDFWNAIDDYMTDCSIDSCEQTIHDFGGPIKDYYNNEDYTWTIAVDSASALSFDFTFFDLEANYDYLYVYDGPDDSSPQISGSPFTGLSGPGMFTSSSESVTFRFYSDGATVNPGFIANYQCDYNQTVAVEQQNEVFSIYPNPANDVINIVSSSLSMSEKNVAILDVSGKVLLAKNFNGAQVVLSISSLSMGYYLISINSNSIIPFIKD